MSESNGKNRIERDARLRWVPIALTRVSPLAQRELNTARVDKLASNFDPEQVGNPHVNLRPDGHFYIVDGQHRVEAMKRMGWGDQQIQCWVYEGLTEEDEAERFLKLNDYLAVKVFTKFRIAVRAGREIETDIDRIVRANALRISEADDGISSVGTLRRVYVRSDGPTLAKTLQIIRDAYGMPGFSAAVIDGIGVLCQRYNGELDQATAVTKLSSVHGGVNGLLGLAERVKEKTGAYQSHCVAAAAVDVINKGSRKKLPSWWRDS